MADYDVIVIGSGFGGSVTALRLSERGYRVAVIEAGVWGGMTERERRALLRKRPDITSWKNALRTSMAAQAQSA